jgi:hypothetical protein
MIDPERDKEALIRFAKWMSAWPTSANDDLELAVSRLRHAAPIDLWNGIPKEFRSKAVPLDPPTR